MPSNRATVLCSYHYDALNRVTASAPSAQASVQRFYLKDRLTTEIQGAVQRSIMQHEDQLLAQRERQTTAVQTHLLATDQQRSVLNLLDASVRHPLAYTPYGHRQNGLLSLLGFNGERRDPVTGSYLLGNGYRAFNPVLMRFNSPDSWSPFGEGGLNAYGYCVGDPVNQIDPNGHISLPWRLIKQNLSKIAQMNRRPITEKTPAWTTRHAQPFAGTEINLTAPPPSPPSSRRSSSSSISSILSDQVASAYPSQADIQPLSTRRVDSSVVPQRLRRGGVIGTALDADIFTVRERYAFGELTPNPIRLNSAPPPSYSDLFPPSYETAVVNDLVRSRFQGQAHKRQFNVRRS